MDASLIKNCHFEQLPNSNSYIATCGAMFNVHPAEKSRYKYCPNCGKPLCFPDQLGEIEIEGKVYLEVPAKGGCIGCALLNTPDYDSFAGCHSYTQCTYKDSILVEVIHATTP